ncbi:MAG: glycerol kinase GlpK [Sphingomonadales bacterium]
MADDSLILAIDQGTTSSRAIVFDRNGGPVAQAQQEFAQIYPKPGWVEHDPEEIWTTTLKVCRAALREAEQAGGQVAAIGITNQRETCVLWDRESGEALHNAIVWQDRRTADDCAQLRKQGLETTVTDRTGLVLDPYFSATKLRWLLDTIPGARRRAENGELAFGTIDSFLLWRLTGGRHATDATNASRTLLFNIHGQGWDPALLELFNIPREVLPEILDSAADFGATTPELLGHAIPVCGIAGDQQAALVGQACFAPGMIKSTFGTGCFALMNTGGKAVASNNRLLTTVGYRIGGQATYALEGSIFAAGAAVKWLRDGVELIAHAADSESLARGLAGNGGVYMVPAFAGLGAPHWNAEARGALFGLTLASGRAEIARAALEAVCYQTLDLIEAMAADSGTGANVLRVDGGMVGNNWLMQFLADIANLEVDRPAIAETTARGAAFLAGLQAGVFESLEEITVLRRTEAIFEPGMATKDRTDLLDGWRRAVAATSVFS